MLRNLAPLLFASSLLACGGASHPGDGRPSLPAGAVLVESEIVPLPHAGDGRSRGGPVIARPTRGPIVWMRYSADGSVLVVHDSAGTLALIDPRTGQVRASHRVTARATELGSVSLSGAGDRALLEIRPSALPQQLLLWDLGRDDFQSVASAPAGRTLHRPALSWDGRLVAYVSEESFPEEGQAPARELVLLEIESGVSAREAIDRSPDQLEFTRSGRAVIRRDGGRIVLHDARRGHELGRFGEAPSSAPTPAIGEGAGEEEQAREDDEGEGEELRREQADRLAFSQPRYGGAILVPEAGAGFVLLSPRDASLLYHGSVEGGAAGEALHRVRWDSSGGHIFAVGADDSVALHNGATGAAEGELSIPEGASWAHRFALSEDGHTVYVVSHAAGLVRRDRRTDDREVLVSSLQDEDVGSRELHNHPPFVLLAPDGSSLAFARGRSIFLVDPAGARAPAEVRSSGGEHAVWQLEFRPDSQGLLSLSRSGSELWEASQGGRDGGCLYDGSAEVSFDAEGRAHLEGCILGVRRSVEGFILGYSPNGRWLLMDGGEEGGGLRVVDAESGETRSRLAHTEQIEVVCDADDQCRPWGALSEDGALVALATGEGQDVALYDGERGRRLRLIRGAVSPSQIYLLGGALLLLDLDGNGAVYDARRGRLRAQSDPDHPGVALSPDRRLVALPGGEGVRLLHTGTLDALELPLEGASNLAFSRDGSVLFFVEPESRRLERVRLADGERLPSVTLPEGFWADPRTISADASELVMCRGGHLVVEQLEAAEGRARSREAGRCPAAIEGLTLSPDGRFAAGRRGTEIFLFRIADGATLHLRRFRERGRLVPFATAEDGRFWAPEEALGLLLARSPGPALTAPIGAATGSSLLNAELVREFFAGGR